MGISARAARPPAGGGGRVLLLLGVLLALAAGVIAVVVITRYSGGGGQTETVVVAAQNLPVGTQLSVNGGNGTMAISAAFITEQINSSDVPGDAYAYTSLAALNTFLNNDVVTGTFYKDDILRASDQRLALGRGAPGSLTNVNPNATVFPTNDVIAQLTLAGKVAIVAGDRVDILVTECNLPNPSGSGTLPCTTQTTLTNVYVYSVDGNTIYLVLDRQKALQLKYLSETGTLELAIRNPNDTTTTPTTTAVNGSTIVTSFGF